MKKNKKRGEFDLSSEIEGIEEFSEENKKNDQHVSDEELEEIKNLPKTANIYKTIEQSRVYEEKYNSDEEYDEDLEDYDDEPEESEEEARKRELQESENRIREHAEKEKTMLQNRQQIAAMNEKLFLTASEETLLTKTNFEDHKQAGMFALEVYKSRYLNKTIISAALRDVASSFTAIEGNARNQFLEISREDNRSLEERTQSASEDKDGVSGLAALSRLGGNNGH